MPEGASLLNCGRAGTLTEPREPDRERKLCDFVSVFVKLTMPREHHNSVQAHLPSGLVHESVSRIPVDDTDGPRNQHSLGHRVLRNDIDHSVVLDPAPGRQILD